ncbi:MAG: aldehyde dehydrogenase family protein [Spirochaetia bacterium]|nr:aldehyde dehydrogenase family protein [Spirochaetia bacterium]MBR5915762.1 aldehyde dehydrogenase family protein [Spirochaetia bacterium]
MAVEENIAEMYERGRKAFEWIEFKTQEEVDEIVAIVGWQYLQKQVAEEGSKLAYEGSGMGVQADKYGKAGKVRGILWDMKGAKTCGIIKEDHLRGITTYAKPMGVVANVCPCTNPCITAAFIGLTLLKTRNAMICSPHPRTKLATVNAVNWGRKALKAIGAPEDLFQVIAEPSNEKTVELMQKCDFAVATGGKALIKVVHLAGTPSVTVGAGNVRAIVDPSADLKHAAMCIAASKCYDNATSCSSENAVSIHVSIYDKMMEELKKVGGYLLDDASREKLRAAMWPDGHTLNRDIVAKPVQTIAKIAGISVPEGTKFIMVKGQKIGPEDMFSNEKLSLILTVWTWEDFETEIHDLKKNLYFSGVGHSCALHSTKPEQWHRLAEFIPTGRVNINMPNTVVNSGSWFAGQEFTTTIGCGTWTGNSHSDNINFRHFLNTTRLAVPRAWYVATDDEVFGKYLAKAKKLIGDDRVDMPHKPAYLD